MGTRAREDPKSFAKKAHNREVGAKRDGLLSVVAKSILWIRTNNMASTTTNPNIVCAPSKNLNTSFLHFATAKEMYAHLLEITQPVRTEQCITLVRSSCHAALLV